MLAVLCVVHLSVLYCVVCTGIFVCLVLVLCCLVLMFFGYIFLVHSLVICCLLLLLCFSLFFHTYAHLLSTCSPCVSNVHVAFIISTFHPILFFWLSISFVNCSSFFLSRFLGLVFFFVLGIWESCCLLVLCTFCKATWLNFSFSWFGSILFLSTCSPCIRSLSTLFGQIS